MHVFKHSWKANIREYQIVWLNKHERHMLKYLYFLSFLLGGLLRRSCHAMQMTKCFKLSSWTSMTFWSFSKMCGPISVTPDNRQWEKSVLWFAAGSRFYCIQSSTNSAIEFGILGARKVGWLCKFEGMWQATKLNFYIQQNGLILRLLFTY